MSAWRGRSKIPRKIPRILAGPFSLAAAMLILAGYLVAGLMPFEWSSTTLLNHASIDSDGILRFPGPGVAFTTSPPHWLNSAIERHQLRLRLRARSFSDDQAGPARILTVSVNAGIRNLTVAQQHSALVLRVRTPQTSTNGTPEYSIPNVFADSSWRDIELRVDPKQLMLAVDQRVVLSETLPEKPFATWHPAMRLALGNELTCDRPWLGSISRCRIDVGQQTHDYLEPGALSYPLLSTKRQSLYDLRFWLRHPAYLWDTTLNLLCFVPLGFFLASWRGPAGSFFAAVTICVLSSGSVEAAQTFCEYRMPSMSDFVANGAGGMIGAAMGRRMFHRSDHSRQLSTQRLLTQATGG